MNTQNRLAFLILGSALLFTARPASARPFSAGSLVIPMDLCYQPTAGKGGWTGTTLPGGLPASYCPDPVATPGNGVLRAYGLVYTFLQNNINVYYIIEPTKTVVSGIDVTITNAAGTPVTLLNHTTGVGAEFMNAGNTSVSFRGAPFIIDVADRVAALAVIKADALLGTPQFDQVQIYDTKLNFAAPVKATLVGPPPLIALNGLDTTNVTILQAYLTDAGLSTTSIAYWPTIGSIFTVLGYNGGSGGGYTDFTTGDALKVGKFKVVWSPHWEGYASVGSNATNINAVLGKMAAFADAGNSVFAECIGMATIEGGLDQGSFSPSQAGYTNGHFLTNSTGTTQGFSTNYLQPVGGTWPNTAGETLVTPAAEATNPIVQIGDYVFNSVNGYTEDYTPSPSVSYVSGIHRLLYTSIASGDPASYDGKDILITGYKDGDATKGQVVYLAGHQYNSKHREDDGSTPALPGGERIPLNTLLFLGQINNTVELSRSAPVVYSDGKTYLGSYVQQTMPATAYPPWQGHFREYAAGALSGTTVTAFSAITPTWDAATHVQTQAAADARTIFTAVPVSGKLTKTSFTTANAGSLGIAAATVTAIRKGGLGGVDHSIPAIIQASAIAGVSTRPTVAYFGALDGMVHAILISGTVSGKNPGDELWAFIPNSQLSLIAGYAASVDGSPSVGDAFIDTGSGIKSWRTLLAVTGGNATNSTLDVLDVTDPVNPAFLWSAKDTVTSSGKTYVLGRASGAAIAPLNTGSGVRYAYFLATDNTNGSAGNAFNMYALDASNGAVIWRFNHKYAYDTTHNDVPGTVGVVDTAGDGGPVTAVLFGDIEGKLWNVSAATGPGGSPAPFYDAALAYSISGDVNFPIESGLALFRDPSNGHLDVVGVTGGADWVPSTTRSHVFKVDTSNNTATDLTTLGVGERVYAVPTVYGNAAYLITSVGNLQNAIGTNFSGAGNLLRINLGATTGVTTLATVKQGAGEVAIDGSGNVIGVSTTGVTQNANSGRTDNGQAVIALQNATAKNITVRAWLDFH